MLFSLKPLSGRGQENAAAQKQTSFSYNFGRDRISNGTIRVDPSDSYAAAKGYGFDFGTRPGAQPFYFSVRLPEGNYSVTVKLGSPTRAALSTVKAESRRLMLENVSTAPGKFITKTFIVNIKDRNITGGGQVKLKPRELTKLDWDDKLTLEFDLQTVIQSIVIRKTEDQVTVFLAGNSTVVNQDEEPWASWGQMVPRFFKPGIAIANHAESGLSLGSFIGSKRLEKILSVIKPGDYVFAEFGHNDEKEKGPEDGPYKSYTERLHIFAKKIKSKNAHLVILTPTARRSFNSAGQMENSHGDYPDAARKVAQEEGLPLIDLTALTTTLYEALGPEESKKAFVIYPEQNLNDNTHFNPYGAYEIAKIVVQGIKNSLPGLAGYLYELPAFDPAHPDPFAAFNWPASPKTSLTKPDGN
ncbi:Lysophospholipase L1 [Pedobacter westerhofensis]|uniref:Lysophospholipase L1 n=2 Tax=Pedobacter westerhofensis TaxID=425512 RepID=A0A521F5K3_9SPHI|nr:Lysophospholipase L1 [Pedobacter westerhofensis]